MEATKWRWERQTYGWWLLKGDSARLNIDLFNASAIPVEGTLETIATALNAASAYRELLEAAEAAEETLTRQGYSENDIDTRGGAALMALRAALASVKGEAS